MLLNNVLIKKGKLQKSIHYQYIKSSLVSANLFVPSSPFLYPQKTSKNDKAFGCFQWVEKGCKLCIEIINRHFLDQNKPIKKYIYLAQRQHNKVIANPKICYNIGLLLKAVSPFEKKMLLCKPKSIFMINVRAGTSLAAS